MNLPVHASAPLDLSIIIVNWNSVDFLRRCLESVFANARDFTYEVLVVDNASYDGSAELIARSFPHVRFIQSPENLGFSGGNNLAYASAKGCDILFLNPDTEVVGSAIYEMLQCLRSDPSAGIVGPKLVNSDHSTQFNCMRAFPTILNEALDSDFLRVGFPWLPLFGTRVLLKQSAHPLLTEVIPGTCVLIRREAFEAAGRFSERYFMYAEDIELSYEVLSHGWKNYYLPSASIVHFGGQSSSSAPSGFSTVMMRESVWKYFRAKEGKWYAAAYRTTTALAAIVRLGLLAIGRTLPTKYRERCRFAFTKWSLVLRWALGLEKWAVNYMPQCQRATTSCESTTR